MQIGQLARRAGVPIDTVRYYERQGILPAPDRQASGYRSYAEEDVSRLQFVRRAKGLGFSLAEVRELLALSARPADDMAGLKAAASSKLADVEHKIAELERVRDGLESLTKACPGHGAVARCPILAALSGDDA